MGSNSPAPVYPLTLLRGMLESSDAPPGMKFFFAEVITRDPALLRRRAGLSAHSAGQDDVAIIDPRLSGAPRNVELARARRCTTLRAVVGGVALRQPPRDAPPGARARPTTAGFPIAAAIPDRTVRSSRPRRPGEGVSRRAARPVRARSRV
jgi:hypothetical protein